MLLVGIDPGNNGAIAFLLDGEIASVQDLPVVNVAHGDGSRRELSPELLHDLLVHTEIRIAKAIVEDVNSFGMGRTSAFRFGKNVGLIQGVLAACGIKTDTVTPAKWKKEFGLGRDKSVARAAAIKLWPTASHYFSRVRDDGRAEACLLAEYARRHCK